MGPDHGSVPRADRHVVFDVGANVGVWLLGAARRAGETGSVHAFEPVPENLARLRTHLSLNALDFVHVDPRVLSSESGEMPFFPSRTSNSGMGSLVRQHRAAEPVRVTATTLDLYRQEHGIGRIDFLKVDVEDAELLVFRGGARLLAASNAPAIMFEADDDLAAALSSSTAATKEFLEYCGYRIFHFTAPVSSRSLRQQLTRITICLRSSVTISSGINSCASMYDPTRTPPSGALWSKAP